METNEALDLLEVGVNTYADIEFADNYVKRYNPKYAPLRVYWSVLTVEEKTQYLNASLSQIEKLKFVGRKVSFKQPLQFPRVNPATAVVIGCSYHCAGHSMFNNNSQIPADVKEAQVENALGIISEQINAISDKQFMTMQALGAVKNTKYNKREAGDLGFGAELKGGSTNVQIASLRAYELIKPFLGGGFRC